MTTRQTNTTELSRWDNRRYGCYAGVRGEKKVILVQFSQPISVLNLSIYTIVYFRKAVA